MKARPNLNGNTKTTFADLLLDVAKASDAMTQALREAQITLCHGRNYQTSQTPAEDRNIDLLAINAMLLDARAAQLWAETAWQALNG
jgi:hypothetical protein